MVLAISFIQDVRFIDFIVIIILGWMLVPFWQRCIDNLTFNTLGLSKDSTFHTFIIALVFTLILLSYIFLFNSVLDDIVQRDVGTLLAPAATLVPSKNETVENAVEALEAKIHNVEEIIVDDIRHFENVVREGVVNIHDHYHEGRYDDHIDIHRSTRPEITRPQITRPQITRPEITRSQITRPEITRSQITRPEITRPEITRPQITRRFVDDVHGLPPTSTIPTRPLRHRYQSHVHPIKNGNDIAREKNIAHGHQIMRNNIQTTQPLNGHNSPINRVKIYGQQTEQPRRRYHGCISCRNP